VSSYSAREEFAQKPPHPARPSGYRQPPRHSATSARRRPASGAGIGTGDWHSVAELHPPQQPAPGRGRRLDANRWHWLLLVPIVIPLIPGLYNRMEPTLFGLPFFFWSQLGFAFLASAVIAIVHLKVR
jgi:hypothetical protein